MTANSSRPTLVLISSTLAMVSCCTSLVYTWTRGTECVQRGRGWLQAHNSIMQRLRVALLKHSSGQTCTDMHTFFLTGRCTSLPGQLQLQRVIGNQITQLAQKVSAKLEWYKAFCLQLFQHVHKPSRYSPFSRVPSLCLWTFPLVCYESATRLLLLP